MKLNNTLRAVTTAVILSTANACDTSPAELTTSEIREKIAELTRQEKECPAWSRPFFGICVIANSEKRAELSKELKRREQ